MGERIQRRRTKGWKMPANAIYIGRPTVFGNPFPGKGQLMSRRDCLMLYRLFLRRRWKDLERLGVDPVVILNLALLHKKLTDNLPKLRGKDLCCWCPLDKNCHGDILLKLLESE